jgi:hypothetical protein
VEALTRDEAYEIEAWYAQEEITERYHFCLDEWLTIYRVIIAIGGVKLTGSDREDYSDVPVCVRRNSGFPIDVVAAQFDFSYADEFVSWIAAAHKAWQDSERAYKAYRAAQRVEMQTAA